MLNSVHSPQLAAVMRAAESGVTPVFPSPQDWRDQWIYFLMVDRFNNPAAPPDSFSAKPPAPFDDPNWNVFQGGTFAGIQAQIPYIKQLGAGAIWMTPVLKNCQYDPTYHGYGIQDFLQAEPRFATNPANADQELRQLVDAIHAAGMYVIFDIVLNHGGDFFAYQCAPGDPACTCSKGSQAAFRASPQPAIWADANGAARADWPVIENIVDLPPDGGVWPKELQRNAYFTRRGTIPSFQTTVGDFLSLKQFATPTEEVQQVFMRVYQHVIAKYDCDGFRIDTFKYLTHAFANTFCNATREFSLSIGKKNFFVFGEVFDTNEGDITSFIGSAGNVTGPGIIGADAVLDFPLVYTLPQVAKGQRPPNALAQMYQVRQTDEQNVFNVHGDPSEFLVTFIDNHDLKQRFYYQQPGNPDQYDDQVSLAVACLFSLQGVPCLYYGTEQGLHGAGTDAAVREALWGKPGGGFNTSAPFYQAIAAIAKVRASQPALRYGRQYVRPISGDGRNFGLSPFAPGVLAFSRILNDTEVVVVANADTVATHTVFVIVDSTLNPAGKELRVLYSNKPNPQAPDDVATLAQGAVSVAEVDGSTTNGPLNVLSVTLQPMEVQILGV